MVFALTAGSLFLCALLLKPFIPALTGSLLIATMTQPLAKRLRQIFSHRTTAAAVATVIVALCIIVPAAFILRLVAMQALGGLQLLQDSAWLDKLQHLIDQIRSYLALRGIPLMGNDLPQVIKTGAGFLGSTFLTLVSGSVEAFTQIVVMLCLLFFWYRDSDELLAYLRKTSPLNSGEERLIVKYFKRTIRASVVGRLWIAAIQGFLAWIAFAALGVPGAVLLANLTSVCALIPAFGAFLVWLPVVGYLLAIHAWTRAAILFTIGFFLLSTVDNLLYPFFVGARAHLHTAKMLLSVFGGLWLFGISGLVLGPLVWVTTELLVAICMRRASRDESRNAGDTL
jgi:predicted PurR-regulated permease PerM